MIPYNLPYNYGSNSKYTNKYLENVSLEIKDGLIPKIWDLY